jgi:putative component of membrane protein insertase Oxa1/YidC/SpoIIIJ protein YidD
MRLRIKGKRLPVLSQINMYSDVGIRKFAVQLINGYQKYISPRKGFSCAYRKLLGGDSCSQYAKHIVAERGLLEAIPAMRIRFQGCKQASLTLRSHSSAGTPCDGDFSHCGSCVGCYS